MKTFVFEKTFLLKPYVFALLGLFIIGPMAVGIGELLHGSVLAMMIGCLTAFWIAFTLFSRLAKTIEISFDADHINFSYDGKTISYLKTEVKGFYSFNYLTQASSVVSMRFDFADGKKIDLSDYASTGKYIPERHKWLQEFITTAEDELGFKAIRLSRARWFGKLGATWFSRA